MNSRLAPSSVPFLSFTLTLDNSHDTRHTIPCCDGECGSNHQHHQNLVFRQEARFEETKSNLKWYSNITEFLRMYASEAAKLVPDNLLDYIYVDATTVGCARTCAPGGPSCGWAVFSLATTTFLELKH
jgi:hypothetical protein